MEPLTAPFSYFGGKRKVADEVWARLGNVSNFIEPFMGSGAVLLGRPHEPHIETVCDVDHYICNFWRAVQAEPDTVARWADWPVNECDLAVRHYWLITEGKARIAACNIDSDHYDVKVAGWWLWGISCWIANGWCSGNGSWSIVDKQWVKSEGDGVTRGIPHIDGEGGSGINRLNVDNLARIRAIAARLRNVRVVCGDWTRVTGDSVLRCNDRICGIFLDPPYGVTDRAEVYNHDSYGVASQAADWAREIGKQPNMRVAFAGYDSEHIFPGWTEWKWKTNGGYARTSGQGRLNAERETLWFSPACLASRGSGFFY